MTKVLVTGAGGYLGSHCVEQLLKGGYTVRETMRGDPVNEAKGKTLRAFDQAGGECKLELVRADLENEHDWPRLMEGCIYVLHTASPFPPNGDASIMKPAVEGTLNVLKAASQCESVKKVVLTSSCAAIAFGQPHRGKVFTEADWTNLLSTDINFYKRSKTMAEKTAWDFMKSLPAEHQLKLTVLNPCSIIGPVLTNANQGTSVKSMARYLNGEVGEEELNKLSSCPMVDVRDVARAHLMAMTNGKSDGERIILYSSGMWQFEMAQIIEKEFGPKGYKIPTAPVTVAPNAESTALIYDNSKARNLLGLDFIPIEKSIIDMCYSLLEKGIVQKKR